MRRISDLWLFLISLFILLVIAVGFIVWVDASLSCKGMPNEWPSGKRCELVKFFYDWQQLLGGLFAIAAAVFGWVAINRQVRQAEEHEKERLRRKHDAARAMLPLALSDITDYAHLCAESLLTLYCRRKEESIQKLENTWHPPRIPSGPTADLRDMVEAASSPLEGQTIARMLARIQVQAARLRSLAQDLRPSDDTVVTAICIERFLVDTIEISALASSAFRFARGDEEFLPTEEPSLKAMFSAAMGLGINDGNCPEVHKRIERQYGKNTDPSGYDF